MEASKETNSDCWEWMGSRLPSGYGTRRSGTRTYYAHRFAYEMTHGPIPQGLEIDHLCHNRGCVNPAHLEAVTHLENVRRGDAVKTVCPQGHLYTVENSYLEKNTGHKHCRACDRERKRATATPAERRQYRWKTTPTTTPSL